MPPPPEKYYAATQICSTGKTGTLNLNGHILNNNTMNHNGGMKTLSNNNSSNVSLDGRNGNTPTTPNNKMNTYSDFDTLLIDDDLPLKEFPRDKLVIVEKLGCGMFGELHLCETKGSR